MDLLEQPSIRSDSTAVSGRTGVMSSCSQRVMREVSWTMMQTRRCNVMECNFYFYNAKIRDDDVRIREKRLRVSDSGNVGPISTNPIFLPDQISWSLFSKQHC
jgi:hypothetical protein